jgi:hypothetical protein
MRHPARRQGLQNLRRSQKQLFREFSDGAQPIVNDA